MSNDSSVLIHVQNMCEYVLNMIHELPRSNCSRNPPIETKPFVQEVRSAGLLSAESPLVIRLLQCSRGGIFVIPHYQ